VTDLAGAAAAAAAVLAAAGVPSPAVDARWLVEAAAGEDPRRRPDAPLDPAAAARLDALVARRAGREPLQLVVGTTAFRTLTLACAPGVFVPRPETEALAGLAVAAARAAVAARGTALVVEPCCGTGAVALAVAAEGPGARGVAGDADPAAVALARANAAAVGAAGAGTVEVREGDLLGVLAPDERGRVDVVVANPPYLPLGDLPTLPPEVADHDPHRALFGGPDGHEVVGALLAAAAAALTPGGTVLCEIDARRGDDALARAAAAGLVDAALHRDLGGVERFLAARRPGPEGSRG
jgi:release factor glutamine methyltransferase